MIILDNTSAIPLYQQIYEQIRRDILAGDFRQGSRLTATRVLAKELNVGRNTVEEAYAQLVLEGYVTSVRGSGFTVNKLELDLNPAPQKNERHAVFSKPVEKEPKKDIKYNFQYGNLDPNLFPYGIWRTLMHEVFEAKDIMNSQYHQEFRGDLELRQELKHYLYRSRGIKCNEEQIVICSGIQSALNMVVNIFPYTDKRVALEDPCYTGTLVVFRNNRFSIEPIPVNADGMDIQTLKQSHAKLAFVSPSHQFPTGATMPIKNRLELLNWANASDCLVIEDDYDSEFRYNGRPIPALQSIDEYGRVIYMGTFSKALSAGLRVGYMVLPPWLVGRFLDFYRGYQFTVPWIEQRILAKFLAYGHWERHIRRITHLHKKRHEALLQAIKDDLPGTISVLGQNAGLHVLLRFEKLVAERHLIELAQKYGVKVHPISPYYLDKQKTRKTCLLLGYANLDESAIPQAVKLLRKAWHEIVS